MALAQHKDGRWYVYGRKGYFPGEPDRTRRYFGRGTGAEAAARELDKELSGAKTKSPPAGPTFYQLALEYFEKRGLRAKSRRELKIRLERIILPRIGHRQAIRVSQTDLDAFVASRRAHKTRRGTNVKDSTIRREITDIKAILNWATRRQPPLLAFNPVASYRAPAADDETILPPTAEEAARIYQKAAEHLKRAIILSWYLGLRPGAVELLTLTWEGSIQCPLLPDSFEKKSSISIKYRNIDKLLGGMAQNQAENIPKNIPTGIIRIRSAHKGGPQLRDIPVHPGLFRHLRQWHEQDRGRGPLIHYHGRAITKIQKSWAGALSRAGIKRRLRPYDLRHHFVTRALEGGADIGALSGIVGSRPETLRRHYQHVSRELQRRTVELIPELKT